MSDKAVFLDRDGVVNVDHAYVYKIDDFEFIAGVFEACQLFQAAGYKIVIVTNQSGIGRGYYTEQDFHTLTDWMVVQFKQHNVEISKVYFCPHHPTKGVAQYKQQCDCRKPKPGMLLQGVKELGLDPSKCIMFGDKGSDMLAAKAAGFSKKILVQSGQSIDAQTITLADDVWQSLNCASEKFSENT